MDLPENMALVIDNTSIVWTEGWEESNVFLPKKVPRFALVEVVSVPLKKGRRSPSTLRAGGEGGLFSFF